MGGYIFSEPLSVPSYTVESPQLKVEPVFLITTGLELLQEHLGVTMEYGWD